MWLCGTHIIVSAAGLIVGNFGSDSIIVVGSKKFIMVSQKDSALHHYLGR